jgi:hypothetical protein
MLFPTLHIGLQVSPHIFFNLTIFHISCVIIVHGILCRYQQPRTFSLGVVCGIRHSVYFSSCLLFRVCFFTDPRVSSFYVFLYVLFA